MGDLGFSVAWEMLTTGFAGDEHELPHNPRKMASINQIILTSDVVAQIAALSLMTVECETAQDGHCKYCLSMMDDQTLQPPRKPSPCANIYEAGHPKGDPRNRRMLTKGQPWRWLPDGVLGIIDTRVQAIFSFPRTNPNTVQIYG